MLKKTIAAILVVFVGINIAVIAMFLNASADGGNQKSESSRLGQTGSLKTEAGLELTHENLIFTMSEISKHSIKGDCWLLIRGKVYDATSYIDRHPGNAQTIIRNCGKDSTAEYDSKGGEGKAHSSSADALLADLYIGDLQSG